MNKENIIDENITFETLLDSATTYIDEEGITLLKKSYEYASIIHKGQKRLSGEDEI